jgi:endonuclease YncB( thermonuclease family)
MKNKDEIFFSLKRKILLEKNKFLFLFLIFLFFVYLFTERKENNNCPFGKEVLVTKVIDGDTVIVEGGYTVRLLSIDADEKEYPCYETAKKKLEALVLNKKIKLEKEKQETDQYGRCLGHLILDKKNINLEMVKEGEAVCRFYSPNIKYKDKCQEMEKAAIKEKRGCKWGK